jgi:hypothetical protein
MSGSDGARVTSPTVSLRLWLSKIGSQVVPLLVVFKSPPVHGAPYMVYRWSWWGNAGTLRSAILAPMRNTPMFRYWKACSGSLLKGAALSI